MCYGAVAVRLPTNASYKYSESYYARSSVYSYTLHGWPNSLQSLPDNLKPF